MHGRRALSVGFGGIWDFRSGSRGTGGELWLCRGLIPALVETDGGRRVCGYLLSVHREIHTITHIIDIGHGVIQRFLTICGFPSSVAIDLRVTNFTR